MLPHSLASYAARADDPWQCQRAHLESHADQLRSPFQHDRDRIIHATAFRRLALKTQVFVPHEGDHYRTRLTHSMEVAQVARTIARVLNLDEDLTEAIALAHDLGHPPFGHGGEDVLKEKMKEHGGFDHNAQTLRILSSLEKRYADWEGLNLTRATLEGLAKHNGPVSPEKPHPFALKDFVATHPNLDLELKSHANLEAQVAAAADDIAYSAHDIDDGLRAGYLTLDDLRDAPIVGALIAATHHFPANPALTRHAITRDLIGLLVRNLIETTKAKLEGITNAQAVREAGEPTATYSAPIAHKLKALKAFMSTNLYESPQVARVRTKARRVLGQLMDHYLDEPNTITSARWRPEASDDKNVKARKVCDYIASMTDAFAIRDHRTLFDAHGPNAWSGRA